MIQSLIEILPGGKATTYSVAAATFVPAAEADAESAVGAHSTIAFEIPDSCLQGLADFEAGRVLDFDTALKQPPPPV